MSAADVIELRPATDGPLPGIGVHVVCCLDAIGSMDGLVLHAQSGSFALKLAVNPARRSRIEARLAWLRSACDGDDQRATARIVPVHRHVQVQSPGFPTIQAIVADLSMTGAALLLSERPKIGAAVTVGKRHATVVRHTPEGVDVTFRMPFGPLTFNERVIL